MKNTEIVRKYGKGFDSLVDAWKLQHFHYDWALQIPDNIWEEEFGLVFFFF